MTLQELRDENERLRRELEMVNKSCGRLREMICAILPVDPPELMEKQIQDMMKQPVTGIDDIVEELLRSEPGNPQKNQQISA